MAVHLNTFFGNGHNSSSGHPSHFGVGALQYFRPCKIIAWPNSVQRALGKRRINSCSIQVVFTLSF